MKVCNCVGVAVLRHDIENSDSKIVKRKMAIIAIFKM